MTNKETVVCGDCRHPLEPEASIAANGGVSEAALYCPQCRAGTRDGFKCPHCGSEVCRQCGSILESPADLGYG